MNFIIFSYYIHKKKNELKKYIKRLVMINQRISAYFNSQIGKSMPQF